jgi:hypothetical protein
LRAYSRVRGRDADVVFLSNLPVEDFRTMVRLRRISPIGAANTLALVVGIPYGIFGLLAAVFFIPASVTLVSTSGGTTTTSVGPAPIVGALTGLFVAWALTIAGTWVFVAIACALYNVIARRSGGIELEFTTVPPQP